MPQHIIVTRYDPGWAIEFKKEADVISKILGSLCINIYHIGSTAVPGLKAKPIIDIMPVVGNIDKVEALADEFVKAGYEYLGEFGIKGRRYLRKGGDERTHQIHIFEENNIKDIERHLAVRDYLRTHSEDAYLYGKLKAELAAKFPYDIDKYCEGKDEFVKQLEKRALAWKSGGKQ